MTKYVVHAVRQTILVPMAALAALAMALAACGCAKPTTDIPSGEAIHVASQEGLKARVQADPVAFIRDLHAETSKLKEFKAVFLRQERLGFFKELAPQETILAEYRDEPFSVRFTWLDRKSEYKQCVYTRGQNDDMVVLLPRNGLLGLPPTIQKYPPQMAVDFGKARNPITDFGPRRMLERVLDGIAKADPLGGIQFTVRDPTEIGPAKEPCFHIELRYPKGPGVTVALQDLYLSTSSLLPVGTYLWRAGREDRSGDTLDAMYLYTQIDPNVSLSDADFTIDADRKTVRKPSGIKTAALVELDEEDEPDDDAGADADASAAEASNGASGGTSNVATAAETGTSGQATNGASDSPADGPER